MAPRPLIGIGLCAGVGGLELGIEIAVPRYRAVCLVEWEAFAATALVVRMDEAALGEAVVWDDLGSFDGGPWRGRVDIVSAGFPCQPFSVAGNQRGVEDERWLWPDIERVLGEVQPRWVVLENVPGLVRHGLFAVLGGLARLGYDAEWGRFSAGTVGAPHRRERFFLLARRVSDTCGDPLRLEPERGAGSAQAGEGMAEPLSTGLEGRPPGAAGRGDGRVRDEGGPTGPGGGAVADAQGGGRRDFMRASEPGRGRHTDGDHEGVAKPQRNRREWPRLHEGPRQEGSGAIGATRDLPLFPPSPTDIDLWARVLAEAPALEPSICRMAYGVADRLEFRVDRLRACGNGVVPLQAAYAILTLAHRAGWMDDLVRDRR